MQRRSRRTGCPSPLQSVKSLFDWGEPTDRPKDVATGRGLKYYSSFTWKGQNYRVGDFVLIASDVGPPYIAKLERLADCSSSLLNEMNYEGKVSWYLRAEEIDDDELRSNMGSNEVILARVTGGRAPLTLVDLETICGICNVVTVEPTVSDVPSTDASGRQQFFCRFWTSKLRPKKLKPLLDKPTETPKRSRKTPKKILKDAHSPNFQQEEIVQLVECRVLVSPVKLLRKPGKENQYTPQKRLGKVTNAPNTVEKLAGNLNEISLRTPCRTPRSRKGDAVAVATPTSSKVENTTTTRYGRPVRRSIFPTEEYPPAKKEEVSDADLVSEDDDADISTEVESSTEVSEDESSSAEEPATRGRPPKKSGRGGSAKKESRFKRAVNRRAALTPSMPSRRVKTQQPQTDIERALSKLHVCAVPDQLPCRENQFAEIYGFVEGKLIDQVGSCMYISGVPGTGKTATVREVMRALEEAQKLGEVPEFKFIEINGMKLSEPHQAYVQILRQLDGRRATAENAADILSDIFKRKRKSSNVMTVLLVDELDLLWTRKQQVLYNIFDWPSHPNSRLVVVAIANTMDLPERMVMNKVASRMGLCRMTFQPYTFQELQEIVRARLSGLELMDPDAMQFISRKVAALSGDARRVLDVCRRAVELSETCHDLKASPSKKAKKYLVSMAHVNAAIQEMFASTKIVAMQSLSLHEKLALRAIVAEFRRTGVEECVFHNVDSQYRTLARLEGIAPVNSSLLSRLLARMASSRLLMVSEPRNDFQQKISLNATADDVNFALRERDDSDD